MLERVRATVVERKHLGSLADLTSRSRHVRFTPDSGHSSVQVGCPKKVPIVDIGERIAAVRRSAQGGHMASVDPTFLRSREVRHLNPTIFAPYHGGVWRPLPPRR